MSTLDQRQKIVAMVSIISLAVVVVSLGYFFGIGKKKSKDTVVKEEREGGKEKEKENVKEVLDSKWYYDRNLYSPPPSEKRNNNIYSNYYSTPSIEKRKSLDAAAGISLSLSLSLFYL